MHKTTNKKRYETPCLIIAEVECVSLVAQSELPELPGGAAGGNANNEILPPEENGDGLVKGSSLWDEGW